MTVNQRDLLALHILFKKDIKNTEILIEEYTKIRNEVEKLDAEMESTENERSDRLQ